MCLLRLKMACSQNKAAFVLTPDTRFLSCLPIHTPALRVM